MQMMKKSRKFASIIYRMAILVACLMGGVFLLFSHQLARLYTDELIVCCNGRNGAENSCFSTAPVNQYNYVSGALRVQEILCTHFMHVFLLWIFRVGLSYVFVNILAGALTELDRPVNRPIHKGRYYIFRIPLGQMEI